MKAVRKEQFGPKMGHSAGAKRPISHKRLLPMLNIYYVEYGLLIQEQIGQFILRIE